MRSRLLGVVGVLSVAACGVHCAAGTTVEGWDSGAPADAAADGDPANGDGPVQADGPLQADGSQADGPLQADGALQADGPLQADGGPQSDGPQQDGGCAVQNTGACDPVCQNCPGQKCAIDSTNHQVAACVANGTVGAGGACTAGSTGDDCVAGFICLSDSKCRQFCRANGDCVAYNGACMLGISWGGTTPFKACKVPDACNPIANTGCTTSGDGCFLWSNDAQTFCLPAGTAGQGAACPNGQECQGGFLCVDRGSGYKCEKVCTLAPPTGCTSPATCQTVSGLTAYGGCV